MRAKISNNFHNTFAMINKTEGELEAIEDRIYSGKADKADKAYQRRLKNTLCGISDCCCSDMFGRR